MKDARREQIEEAAKDKREHFKTLAILTGGNALHYIAAYEQGFAFGAEFADSHPDTAESDEGPYRYSHPKLKAAFDEGYAHSRKSQAAWDISVKDRITMDDFRRRTEALTTMHEVLLNEAVKAERERIKEELKKSESWKHRRCPSWLEIAIIEILNPKETK
jgi:hypothetical protein